MNIEMRRRFRGVRCHVRVNEARFMRVFTSSLLDAPSFVFLPPRLRLLSYKESAEVTRT